MLELCVINNGLSSVLSSKALDRIDTICCASSQINEFSLLNKNIALCVDYPYGLANTKIREHEVVYGARSNIKYLDITLSNKYIAEINFKTILNEIKIFSEILGKKVELRPIINTINFETALVSDLCSCLVQYGISTVITGTGVYNTDISDDLINAAAIKITSGLKVIVATQYCTDKTYSFVKQGNIYGLRVTSEKSLDRLFKYGV